MINPDHEFRVEGSHWISPVNFDAEVTGDFDFPKPLGLIDSTLRKIRYTAGATTSVDGFLRVAAALEQAGIKDESLNLDWWGDPQPNRRELELVREILAGGFAFTTNVYADRLLGQGEPEPEIDPRGVVDLLAGLGAKVIAPGIVQAPSAEAEARQFKQLENTLSYAKECGLGYTITLAQCGRRDWDALLRAANVAVELGARRLDLMDSTSSLSPEAMKVFIRRFKAGLKSQVPLTMHVHDDFGLGTAGAIAAAIAGAGPDVSVNGTSYRCGFPPLEEVATSLEVLYGVDTGIELGKLQGLSELVAYETGVPLPQLKPISGTYAYLKHTPGDVLACLRDGANAFPPISGCLHASVTGAEVKWVWDSLNTRAMVRQLGVLLGTELKPDQVDDVLEALDRAVNAKSTYPRWLERDEVETIFAAVVSGQL
ncbi:hypothetical protein ACFV9C_18490 [Kribbella sp. NPDC059898]|uniref:hypothetical protein n=1 Tax=Kribbella sp. NPDC059898 TaxID=3346995 RepID=UPI0036541BC5